MVPFFVYGLNFEIAQLGQERGFPFIPMGVPPLQKGATQTLLPVGQYPRSFVPVVQRVDLLQTNEVCRRERVRAKLATMPADRAGWLQGFSLPPCGAPV